MTLIYISVIVSPDEPQGFLTPPSTSRLIRSFTSQLNTAFTSQLNTAFTSQLNTPAT
ncbi:MAG: hypothetical protein MR421_08885 [Prevotella sp.]|nr:hypothetical protein [Prevotella sp.]